MAQTMRPTLLLPLLSATLALPAWGASQLRVTTNFDDRSALQATLDNLTNADVDIDDIAVGPGGEWMIVAGNAVYRSGSCPAAMTPKVQEYIASGRRIDAIVIGPNGSWAVAADDWFFRGPNLPQGQLIQDVVKARQNAGRQIDELVLTPSGGFVVLSEGYYNGQSVGSGLWAAIKDGDKSKRRARRIAIGGDGRWIITAEQWQASAGLSTAQRDNLESWQRMPRTMDHVVLGTGDDYIYYSHNNAVTPPPAALAGVEYGLIDEGGVARNIWRRMNELDVPGVSVAVIDGGQVRYARGYGRLEGNGDRFVRATTPYSIASMSKYLTALGAMRVAQASPNLSTATDARVMADGDWPIMSYWQDRGDDNDMYGTALPYGLTLRRLLSHTAAMRGNGTNDGWGGMLDAFEAPTSWILLGYGCDGGCAFTNKTVWYDAALGTPATAPYTYSNAGYEVVRGMLEDVRGEPFADIMQDEVFGPLGMTNTTYDILDPSWDARSAPGLDGSDASLARRTYQWYAGGGVYSTPEDYAKAMMVVIDQAGSSGYLPVSVTDQILADQRANDGTFYGFGVLLSQSQVDETSGRFAHGGYIPNYSWTRMVGVPSAGKGIVIMTNDTSLDARRLVCEIEDAFRTQNGIPSGGC